MTSRQSFRRSWPVKGLWVLSRSQVATVHRCLSLSSPPQPFGNLLGLGGPGPQGGRVVDELVVCRFHDRHRYLAPAAKSTHLGLDERDLRVDVAQVIGGADRRTRSLSERAGGIGDVGAQRTAGG